MGLKYVYVLCLYIGVKIERIPLESSSSPQRNRDVCLLVNYIIICVFCITIGSAESTRCEGGSPISLRTVQYGK